MGPATSILIPLLNTTSRTTTRLIGTAVNGAAAVASSLARPTLQDDDIDEDDIEEEDVSDDDDVSEDDDTDDNNIDDDNDDDITHHEGGGLHSSSAQQQLLLTHPEAMLIYDSIALHVEQPVLKGIIDQYHYKKQPNDNDEIPLWVNLLFDKIMNPSTLSTDDDDDDDDNVLILETIEEYKQDIFESNPQAKESYAPHYNRYNWNENIQRLMEARAASLDGRNFCWSCRFKLIREGTEPWPESSLPKHRQALHSKSLLVLEEKKQNATEKAEHLLTLLADHLPITTFQRIMHVMDNIIERQEDQWRKSNTQLFSLLKEDKAKHLSHLHFIMDPLADFFYVDPYCEEQMRMAFLRQRLVKRKWKEMRNAFAKAIHLSQEVDMKMQHSMELILTDPAKRKNPKFNNVNQYHLKCNALPMSHERQPIVDHADRTLFVDNVPVDIDEETLEKLYTRFGPVHSVCIYNARPDLHPGGTLTKKLQMELKRKQRMARRVMHQSKTWTRARTPLYAKIVFNDTEAYNVASSEALRAFGMIFHKHDLRSYSALQSMTNLYIEGVPVGVTASDLEYALAQRLGRRRAIATTASDDDDNDDDDTDSDYELSLWLDAYSQRMAEKRPTSLQIAFPSYHYAAKSFQAVDQVVKEICEPKIRELDNKTPEEIDAMIRRVGVQWFLTPKDAEKYWRRQIGMDFV